MTDVQAGLSRGQFIRNAAKGSVVLVGAGGVLASMDGVAFAKSSSVTKSDITVLQTGFIAETLAVTIYGAILKTYFAKLKLDPGNLSYFQAAYKDEQAHLAAWKAALGPKNTPDRLHAHRARQVRREQERAGQDRRNPGGGVRLHIPGSDRRVQLK